MLGCWGDKDGDIGCGGLGKEMALVVWERRWRWWCGKGDGVGGVGFVTKEELY